MVDAADKLTYFQAITGLDDPDLCTDILQAHGWDLQLAVSSFTSDNPAGNAETSSTAGSFNSFNRDPFEPYDSGAGAAVAAPGLAWKLITLPFSVISGSLGLISGAVGFGLWAAGGILSHSLGMVGLGSGGGRNGENSAGVPASAAAREAMDFVEEFERCYGFRRPNFVGEGFMDALQRSRNEYKMLFVYLDAPDHADTAAFCEGSLCSEVLADFVNENFVAWGGSIRASEGFKMSNSFKASRFPFCAVVLPAANHRIALIQQVEGPKSPEEMLMVLQRVLEESGGALVSARLEAEERRNNIRLREEQDAAYRAALEADQARECQRKEEQERQEREAAEAERKQQEEQEDCERAAHEAAKKEAALAKLRQEKALSLGPEPEKGPDVSQVLVRFPNGERKDRRFCSTDTIKLVYEYVDSLGLVEMDAYNLVSNFPRVVYGTDNLSITLKEAGLHPQASLFVELN